LNIDHFQLIIGGGPLVPDDLVKSPENAFLSFRRKPESRTTKDFWTPAPVPDSDPGFTGVTAWKASYERIGFESMSNEKC
jgi:hypothetical protein